MVKFLAAIPPTSSAIKIGGEAGECPKLTLDVYLGSDNGLDDLLRLRGKQLKVTISAMDEGEK